MDSFLATVCAAFSVAIVITSHALPLFVADSPKADETSVSDKLFEPTSCSSQQITIQPLTIILLPIKTVKILAYQLIND